MTATVRIPQGAPNLIAPDTTGLNFYRADPSLSDLLRIHLPEKLLAHIEPHLDRLGALAGGPLDEHARMADRHVPVLHQRDRFGRDIQWIEYHPAYRELEKVAFGEFGIHAMSHRPGILGWPQAPEPTPQQMAKSDLPLLPRQTERWLEAQRPALPAPAQRLADDIGIKLEAIGPQLATLDPREPAAYEFRKLMAEELPELVEGYKRVPERMRRETRNGSSPDKQLVEGLRVVDEELLRMSEQLVSGDLDKLATQGRYLALKYRGEDGEPH